MDPRPAPARAHRPRRRLDRRRGLPALAREAALRPRQRRPDPRPASRRSTGRRAGPGGLPQPGPLGPRGDAPRPDDEPGARRPVHGRRPRSPPRSMAGIERRDPRRAPHRQRGGRRGRARRPRLARSLPRRRHGIRGALRALRRPATSLGRGGHPLAQPPRGLPRAAPGRDPRPARRLGLPARRRAGPSHGRLDDPAVRARPTSRRGRAPPSSRSGRSAARTARSWARSASRSASTSTEPAEIARATQALATALETCIREAPEQWCVFKPMWPDDPAAEAALAARAAPAPATRAR